LNDIKQGGHKPGKTGKVRESHGISLISEKSGKSQGILLKSHTWSGNFKKEK
jgi:hypothetical protein